MSKHLLPWTISRGSGNGPIPSWSWSQRWGRAELAVQSSLYCRLSPPPSLCSEPVNSTLLINSRVNNCTTLTSKSQTHPQAPRMPQTYVLFQNLYLKNIMIAYSNRQVHPSDLYSFSVCSRAWVRGPEQRAFMEIQKVKVLSGPEGSPLPPHSFPGKWFPSSP